MGASIVQFREDDEALAYLRSKGLSPNEFGRQAFEASLRRLRAEEKIKKLEKLHLRLPDSAEAMIRRERDEH